MRDKGWQSREWRRGGERGEPLDEECNVYGGRRVFRGWGREEPTVGAQVGNWHLAGIRHPVFAIRRQLPTASCANILHRWHTTGQQILASSH